MRILVLASLLTLSLAAVAPHATAAPNCALDPAPIDCTIEYADWQVAYRRDQALQAYEDAKARVKEGVCYYDPAHGWTCVP